MSLLDKWLLRRSNYQHFHKVFPYCFGIEESHTISFRVRKNRVKKNGSNNKNSRIRHIARSNDTISNILLLRDRTDRKSTRLNSSHQKISYAVFCLKKKN